MTEPLEAHEETARRWLARGRVSSGSADVPSAAARVYETLFQSLAPVIGADAVGAMLVRSAKVSRAKYPCLGGLLPEPGLPESHAQVAQQLQSCLGREQPAAAMDAATALYGALLRLMTKLIGEQVTSQIVSKAFDEVEPTMSKEME